MEAELDCSKWKNGDEEKMLKELLNNRCRIQLEKVEMNALDDPAEETGSLEVIVSDSVTTKKKSDCLRVECTRHVGFEPVCNFEITVTYSVEHYLKESDSLKEVSDAAIQKEVEENIPFYIQEKRGLMNRVSLIIAQLTSAFDSAPMILPPYFQTEESTT